MNLKSRIKAIFVFVLTIQQFSCKETSGLHPGIMINRTKAVPLYIETLKKQVQEDDLGKFSWSQDEPEHQETINENSSNNPPISYQKSQDIISNSKITLLFNVTKKELSDFVISKLDEKNFIIETELKEIPIANIKRKLKISITQFNKIDLNIRIYDEKSVRHEQEEILLKKKILNNYNSVLNSMKI